jgi:hypothetical protein
MECLVHGRRWWIDGLVLMKPMRLLVGGTREIGDLMAHTVKETVATAATRSTMYIYEQFFFHVSS